MDWIIVICVALQKDTGTCGHVRQAPYATIEQCNEQRDAVARQREVAYAFCRPGYRVELVK